MNNVRALCLVLASACAVVTGCDVDDTENPFGEDAFDVPFETMTGDPPPTGQNGDAAQCLHKANVHSVLQALSKQKLNYKDNTLAQTVSQLSDCTQIVRTAIMCALDTTKELADPVTGELFQGHWKLAPGWETAPLDVAGQRWVTACMIQKLNGYGWPVSILLEGAKGPINEQPSLQSAYPFEEATAFGNYFLDEPELYVCRESDLVEQCKFQSALADLELFTRICDSNSNTCGLHVIGNCSSACQRNGAYWKCQPPDRPMYEETIRVQLQTYAGKHCPTP
jgi:hypothetical protein